MIDLFAQTVDLEQQITSLGMRTVLIAALILVGATLITALLKDHYPKLKLPLFIIMASTLIISTLTLFGSTIYLNTKSESGGPVHWHTEIELWACGAELNLRDPVGALSNKVGSTTYHEHNDKHIHLEGVVIKKAEDASLEKFMRVTGGAMSNRTLSIPLSQDTATWLATDEQIDGDAQVAALPNELNQFIRTSNNGPVLELANGQNCGGQPAEVQAFVYAYNKQDKTYSQHKLDRPQEYVMREESSLSPPADCVIVEFDVRKERTNRLCQQYGVRDVQRCTQFGVKGFDPEQCNLKEVGYNAQDHQQQGSQH